MATWQRRKRSRRLLLRPRAWRLLLPLVALLAALAAPGFSWATPGQFGNGVAGALWGCPPAGYKYGNAFTLGESGFVTSIEALMKGSGGSPGGSQFFRAMVYAADGPGGGPGTLLAVSAERSVASTDAQGVVSFPISPKVFLNAGVYFLMEQSGPADAQGCISEVAPAPGGAINNYNLDAYADGPSNPAGPASIESKLYTISATYEPAKVFGNTAPGTSLGCPGSGFKYGNRVILGESGTISAITAYMGGANDGTGGSQLFRTMIYRADGPGGGPGTLLAVSGEVSVAESAAPAFVDFPVSPAKALTGGTYWLLQQSGPAAGKACLSQVVPAPGGAPSGFNVDAYGDGPSDPAGPVTTQSADYTLFAVYAWNAGPTDTTPPTITGSRAPAANANGWNNGDVVVSFTCADEPGGSGVASVSGPTTLSANGAGQSVTGTCTDNAGNSASATVSGMNIDRTVPIVSYAGNAVTYTLGQAVSITCTAADALSGIASSTCANTSGPAWSFGAGAHTLSATATDRAGNTGSGSTTFTVAVTAEGLCALTTSFTHESARYQARRERQRAAVDSVTRAVCATVTAIAPRHNPALRRVVIAVFQLHVTHLARGGWISAGHAATLTDLARSL